MNKTANIKTASNALKIGALVSAVVLAMSVFAGLLSPTLAFANEEASSSGIGAIIPNPIEFFPMLIAFIILCIVLGKFGWPMFNGMLEKREKSIRDALEQSEMRRLKQKRFSRSTKSNSSQLKQNQQKSLQLHALMQKQLRLI